MNKKIEDIELIDLEEDDGQAENPYYPEFGDGEKEGDGEWEEDLYGEDLEDIIKEEEDYFDNEVVGKNADEDLQTAYRNYNKDFNELIELLGSIIEKGELTEEDKTALNTINTEYDDSYTMVKQEISNAQALALENQLSEIKSEMLTGSQEDVLNALTNGGMAQGIYLGEDGELYVNAQFLQTRGLTVVNEDGQVTLSIDDDGNLTTSGDIVGGTITGAVMKAMRIDTEQVQIESPDGAMSISGALQQFKDDKGNVRIKIGKDEDGKFKFILYGENGQTILIDQNGIKQDALSVGIVKSEHIETNSIGTNHLQAGSITAESGIIGEGAIGNAQISDLDAGKLSAGKVDTSKVEVAGTNNHLKIKGNRLQVFQGVGSNAKERVSLGDVNGDGTVYGLRVRGIDGKTVLLDENGVTSEGLTDGSITNNKISEDANIDGAKLNINSVINKINEDGTETINGTKIEVEGTTLSAKLSSIINQQNEDGQKISQAQSQISANTNAIGLKVDSQTYQTDKKNMTSQMNKNTSEISAMKGQIALKVGQTEIENVKNELGETINSKINDAKGEIKITTDAISQTVSNLSKTIENKADNSQVSTVSNKVASLETNLNGITQRVESTENTTKTLTTKVNNAQSTADSKAKVFTSTPTTPYKIGDLWVQGSTGDVMKCKNARSNGNYVASDWEKASKYTDDTKANAVDGKVTTLQGTVTSNSKKVATLETNLNSITQRVQDTETTTSTLTSKVDNVQNSANSAQSTANSALNTANENKSNITSLTTRVSTAESKLTKDSLTTTIGNHYTTKSEVEGVVTSKGYQTQSQVQQTVNSLQAKFTSSGGYNLLRNGCAKNGTAYWSNNGGGISVGTAGSGHELGEGATYFNSSFPSGITGEWIALKPNTDYVYSAKLWSASSFKGTTTTPLHYWCSSTKVAGNTQLTVIDYKSECKANEWNDVYVHFRTKSGAVYFKPFIYLGGTTNINFSVSEIMLCEGVIKSPYSPHPSEVYDGITTIDKDGITVTASNVKSKTSMSADGFKITKTDTNEDVLKVGVDGKLIMKGDIQGSTFSSTSGAFKVLDDGTVDASTLSVDEEISTDTLTVQHINNSKYQQVLDMNVNINIDSTSQNSVVFEDGATYKSINDFLDACPRNLNGYTITLNLLTDINENMVIDGLNSGTLTINFNGKTVYGYIFLTGEHMRYRLYGNKNGSTGGTTVGSVMPNIGNSQTGGYYSIVIHSTWAFVYDLKVYGGKASGNNIGIRVANWANAYLSGIQFINCYNGLRAYNLGRAYLSSSSGTTSNYAFASYHSGEIILNASNQAGRGGSTNHTYVANNSTVISTGATFSSTAVAGSNTNTSTNKVSKTVTINSTLGDTYRTTVYNSWKKDSSVRQGQWSTNGINNGCWFYGSQFEEYKSKEIEKVSITIKRQAGGSSSAVKHTLKMHNHATRPTGKPTFATGFSKDFDLAVNDSITINLTSTEDINAFKQNKGFGLVAKSGTQTYYSVCSGSANVKITYKE